MAVVRADPAWRSPEQWLRYRLLTISLTPQLWAANNNAIPGILATSVPQAKEFTPKSRGKRRLADRGKFFDTEKEALAYLRQVVAREAGDGQRAGA
jgi:hypothetical protein